MRRSFDRFSLWLAAGVVTAGMSMAMVAGAGLALADDGSTGSDNTSSSESSNSTGKKQDSDDKDTPKQDPKNDDKKDRSENDRQPSEQDDTEPSAKDEGTTNEVPEDSASTDDDIPKKGSDHVAVESATRKTSDQQDKATTTAEVKKAPAEDAQDPVADTKDSDEPARTEEATAQADETGPVDEAVAAATAKQSSVESALAFAAAEPAATTTGPTLINVIGSLFFNIFQAVEKLFAGPPAVPPGANVRVSRAPLVIDCGPGFTVDADWYFPTTGPEPTRLIYLQHGFPATASMYDYTAAELAERNHAIVVAPSISGNLFDCDGCQLGGDPMHAAIAKLFLGDREALLASARAAGFEGDELPQRFVIAGHSGGGQLAAGAAGYFEQFAPDAEDHNLVGVLLFDTSPVGGAIARGVAKIPDDIPVYVIAAEPGVLNSYGGANEVLEAARPGQFVGVQLVGGVHLDPLQTHNPLVQFAASLIAGFPRPENVEAVQELAEGWINDWYEGSHTGIYGDLGSTIDIPTSKGTAQAYVLPAPAPQLTLIDLFLNALMNSTAILNFAYCAEDPSASAANEDLTENSTPNTVLSLDGKGSTGQSVGQHVCTG